MKNYYKDLLFFMFFRNYVYHSYFFLLFVAKTLKTYCFERFNYIQYTYYILFFFVLPGEFSHHTQTGEKSDQVRQNHKPVKHI